MNKSIHPVVAIFVILFFGGLVGLIFYFHSQSLGLARLTFMDHAPDGSIVTQLGNRLFTVGSNGGDTDVTDLSKNGIEDNVGDFAFFGNGDLLIRVGDSSRSVQSDIEAFGRLKNMDSLGDDHGRLYRCKPDSQQCKLFSRELPGFDRTFRLDIDRTTDTVYLADTSRHQIYKLDSSGNLLATKTGFRFPNEILRIDDSLWLADTNHHRIVQLSEHTREFGEELASHKAQVTTSHVWPTAFAQAGSEWWVIVMNNDMENGRIIRFGLDWTRVAELPLPRHADPVSILTVDNAVIVADNRNFTVYQFDFEGRRIADFGSPALVNALAASKTEAARLDMYVYICWGIFIVALILGFWIAIRIQAEEKPSSIRAAEHLERERSEVPITGVWIEPNRLFKMFPYILAGLAVASCLLTVPVMQEQKVLPFEFYGIVFAMILVAFVMMIPVIRIAKFKIGVFDGRVELIDHKGARHAEDFSNVLWTDYAFKIGDYVVPLKNQKQNSLFPRDKIDKWLLPRLSNFKKTGNWQMTRAQWRSPEGMLKHIALMMAMLLAIVIWISWGDMVSWYNGLPWVS